MRTKSFKVSSPRDAKHFAIVSPNANGATVSVRYDRSTTAVQFAEDKQAAVIWARRVLAEGKFGADYQ